MGVKYLNIGGAVVAMKQGKIISRKLWDGDAGEGKEKFIYCANNNKSIWQQFGGEPGFHWNHDHHDLLATDYFIMDAVKKYDLGNSNEYEEKREYERLKGKYG
jgi:hypothetical protein